MAKQLKSTRLLPLLVLWFAVLGSAIAVVFSSHQCRQLYATLTDLQREQSALKVEWGRFLLEESSWTSLNRVEKEAAAKMGMRIPEINEMVIVRQ